MNYEQKALEAIGMMGTDARTETDFKVLIGSALVLALLAIAVAIAGLKGDA